jgi:hypothetical protein
MIGSAVERAARCNIRRYPRFMARSQEPQMTSPYLDRPLLPLAPHNCPRDGITSRRPKTDTGDEVIYNKERAPG